MNRRQFISASTTTGAIALIAGCTSSNASPENTTTTTELPTTTTERTTTQTYSGPAILSSGLISRWKEFGDVNSYRVDAVGKGAYALIGFRYEILVQEGTLDITQQVKVFDPNGERVAIKNRDDEQLTEGDGIQTWENAFYFDTSTWDRGEYTYEVLIRDNASNKVSETKQGSFTVNAPLDGEEATLVSVDDPDTVSVGESYSFTLTLENTSTRDGSVVSPLSARFKSQDTWETYSDSRLAVTMASGETNTWESGEISYEYEDTVEYRLDAINETWSIEVTA